MPDLIDKPLFYGGARSSLITGTRTFGHTGLLLLALLLAAAISRKAVLWALFAGVATHLALDIGGEAFGGSNPETAIWPAVFFPALGWRFPVAQFGNIFEHLQLSAHNFYVLAGELIGAAVLAGAWIRRRQSS